MTKRRRLWIPALVGLIAFVIVAVLAVVAAVPLTSDAVRRRMVATLSERLDADVAIGTLHWRVFPTIHAEGADLTLRRHGHDDAKPLITIKRFSADAGFAGLVHKHVAHVTIDGLDIEVPPNDQDNDDEADAGSRRARGRDESRADQGAGESDGYEGTIIDTLDASGAQVVINPKKKNRAPRVWAIHALRLRNVGARQAMPFDAALTNGVPPGEIATTGTFGPWQRKTPGRTPLDGAFTFARADLSVFHGISGILSARGRFGGVLERIVINGETETPDFTIKVGGHPFGLRTKYQATVDGTNGDTYLDRIDARFLESSLVAKGSVIDAPPGVHGRVVALDIVMGQARVEDVLRMAIKTESPMQGALQLTTKFLLPPGEADVADRLRLDGRFTMARVRFASYDVQGKINELSHRSRGLGPDQRSDRVVSNFQGRFRLANGRLTLPSLTFSVPGANVQLAGRYALKPETLDFTGALLMDAKVSETQTGIKSLLLKVVDPLFRRNGRTTIPIHVRGTRNEPDFGLDVGRVFKRGDKP